VALSALRFAALTLAAPEFATVTLEAGAPRPARTTSLPPCRGAPTGQRGPADD